MTVSVIINVYTYGWQRHKTKPMSDHFLHCHLSGLKKKTLLVISLGQHKLSRVWFMQGHKLETVCSCMWEVALE